MSVMNRPYLRQSPLLVLLIVVTIAFGWILQPLFGALLWGTTLALLVYPLHYRLAERMGKRRNVAALITLVAIVLLVIVPLAALSVSVVSEISAAYSRMRSGEIDIGQYFQNLVHALPQSVRPLLEHYGLTDIASAQQRLLDAAGALSRYAGEQALSIGQNTLQFFVELGVMLYLMFFLLRDGQQIGRKICNALPLPDEQKSRLVHEFMMTSRATVVTNVVVAALQGALGGLIFALLGIEGALVSGVLMAFFSLLPALGAAIVWIPVAIYLLATGSIWRAVALVVFGLVVIGLIDNLLRPMLVGKDTRLPDWLVLISTLGGMAVLGISGFVVGPIIAAMFIAAWDLHSTNDDAP
jgi:predicted PurR-regulated permease PerM